MSHYPADAREAAYFAALAAFQNVQFAENYLNEWAKRAEPSDRDYRLAQEITYGSIRMARHLDERAILASSTKKLKLSLKQKCLLRIAVYQLDFLSKVPNFAVINETVKLAKKIEGNYFAKFINALLRNISTSPGLALLNFDDDSLGIYYSLPTLFIQKLRHDYGNEALIPILKALNTPIKTMARVRDGQGQDLIFCKDPLCYTWVQNLEQATKDPNLYIQNATPGTLFARLAKKMQKKPKKILDLCASPGGKLLLAHDFFPDAALFGNDISEEKMEVLKQNALKYGFLADWSIGRGEDYPSNEKFDLIILDVPCSNTGVFNKRAEARWRFDEKNIQELETMQLAILEKAKDLLSADGEIWYLTCSILKAENEALITRFTTKHNLHKQAELAILPSEEGWDGGYGASITYGVAIGCCNRRPTAC